MSFSPLARASLWMLGAVASFAAMAIGIREVSDTMRAFQILFFRSLIGLVVIAAVIACHRDGLKLARTRQFKLQLLRNTVHFAGQWGWTAGIALLPLATVFALEFTSPIWAAILAALFLKERLNRGRLVAVALGFAGILIIVRPGLSSLSAGTMIILFAALCYSGAHIATKGLTRTDGPVAVLFWMSLLQLPPAFLAALPNWTVPTLADLPPLLAVGLAGLSAHYCLTSALRLADATLVIPFDFLRLPLIAVLGALIYNEALDPLVFIGGAVIFAGSYYSLRYEARSRRTGIPS